MARNGSILSGVPRTTDKQQRVKGVRGMIDRYIETDCTITHNDQSFTAGGAIITDNHIVAYLGAHGVLTDWHGKPLGRYHIVSTWRTPRSYISGVMHAVHATVNGKLYKGRSAGEGMSFMGKLSHK